MKQEEDDILIKSIRKRLDNYSEQVPDKLWSSLEKEFRPVHTSSSFYFHKMAVAATILIAVITSVCLWVLNMPVDTYIQEIAAISAPGSMETKYSEGEHRQESSISQSTKTIDRTLLARAEKNENKLVECRETECNTVIDEVITGIEVPTDAKCNEQSAEKVDNRREEEIKERNYFYTGSNRNPYGNVVSLNKKDYKKWAVSVSYVNTPSIKNNAIPGFSTLDRSCSLLQTDVLQANDLALSQDRLKKVKPMRKVLLNNVGKESKTDVEHKMPVTAGVSFRYKLSKNFAVETGLTYTMLSSELRSGTANDFYVEEYRLHYLGLPLKGNWMFLDTKYLTLYLSAGGELEKSLAGKYKKTYVTSDELEHSWNENVKQMQWSLLGNVGIQFNATENFGIYVEPGIVHYFDDGSEVQTIRKERPTNFNLQLGLRWTY